MSEKIKPYGGSSNNRLTKLINRSNATHLIEGVDFEFGTPVTVNKELTNTRIVFKPKSKAYKTQFIDYDRLDIAALAQLPESEVSAVVVENWPFDIHKNLSAINRALGLDLTASEVVGAVHADAGQMTLPLQINELSLAWLPSEYWFEIQRVLLVLSEIWTNTVLDGLHAPAKKV